MLIRDTWAKSCEVGLPECGPLLYVRYFGRQQIRAVLPRFLQRFLPPPAANFFVIAAEQNLGHRPAAEFRRARVMWAVEKRDS